MIGKKPETSGVDIPNENPKKTTPDAIKMEVSISIIPRP
jgi:hypothetical protein